VARSRAHLLDFVQLLSATREPANTFRLWCAAAPEVRRLAALPRPWQDTTTFDHSWRAASRRLPAGWSSLAAPRPHDTVGQLHPVQLRRARRRLIGEDPETLLVTVRAGSVRA
jgi:hypothetical protein